MQIPPGIAETEITRRLSEIQSELQAIRQFMSPWEGQSARPALMHLSERGFERDLQRFTLATKKESSYRRIAHYEERKFVHGESYPLAFVRSKTLPPHPTERAISRSVKRMRGALQWQPRREEAEDQPSSP